jgi:hypothetical protein
VRGICEGGEDGGGGVYIDSGDDICLAGVHLYEGPNAASWTVGGGGRFFARLRWRRRGNTVSGPRKADQGRHEDVKDARRRAKMPTRPASATSARPYQAGRRRHRRPRTRKVRPWRPPRCSHRLISNASGAQRDRMTRWGEDDRPEQAKTRRARMDDGGVGPQSRRSGSLTARLGRSDRWRHRSTRAEGAVHIRRRIRFRDSIIRL